MVYIPQMYKRSICKLCIKALKKVSSNVFGCVRVEPKMWKLLSQFTIDALYHKGSCEQEINGSVTC